MSKVNKEVPVEMTLSIQSAEEALRYWIDSKVQERIFKIRFDREIEESNSEN